jgi:hypothetical protein
MEKGSTRTETYKRHLPGLLEDDAGRVAGAGGPRAGSRFQPRPRTEYLQRRQFLANGAVVTRKVICGAVWKPAEAWRYGGEDLSNCRI